MAEEIRVFILERPARRSGGDRYVECPAEGQKEIFGKIYVNQCYSRPKGQALTNFIVTITEAEAK